MQIVENITNVCLGRLGHGIFVISSKMCLHSILKLEKVKFCDNFEEI